MDELDKGLEISVKGALRDEALARFARQIAEWGVALPPVDALVLDFGLGKFEEVGLIEYWIANEIGAGYCGKYLFVFNGQTCPLHHHREKMETFFVVKGRVRMTLDGEEQTMEPGGVLPVKTGLKHSFTGIGPALLLELSRPCIIDDNFFTDSRIPIGGNWKGK
jgi:mannose-6-phosphate isomerase-like protein (cupin superfamily)